MSLLTLFNGLFSYLSSTPQTPTQPPPRTFDPPQFQKCIAPPSVIEHLTAHIELASIPVRTSLEEYSCIPFSLARKKIVVFSEDRGGFGDFIFGQKLLACLKEFFPQSVLYFVTNSPKRASFVSDPQFPPLDKERESISPEEIASIIDGLSPDLLVEAPCSGCDRPCLKKPIPTLSLREYGYVVWGLGEKTDYLSGAGIDQRFLGIFIDKDLFSWAEQQNERSALATTRLSELQKLPSALQEAILETHSSKEAMVQFFANNELFLGHATTEATAEFIITLTKLHNKLRTSKNLTLVVSTNAQELSKILLSQKIYLQNLNISKITISSLNEPPTTLVISETHSRTITCVCATLTHFEFLTLIKASGKEMLTTGDQSLGEAISAHKHWIQEYLFYKTFSVQSIIDLAPCQLQPLLNVLSVNPWSCRPDIRPCGATRINVDDRTTAYAELLFQARTNTSIAEDWDALNHIICVKQDIKDTLRGLVFCTLLVHNKDFQQIDRRMRILASQAYSKRQIKDEFVKHADKLRALAETLS